MLYLYAGDVTARLDDMVGSMALLSAELHTSQRQQASLQYLLTTAEVHAKGVVPKVAAEVTELREHLHDFGAITAQQLLAVQDVDRQLAEWRQPSPGGSSSKCIGGREEMTGRRPISGGSARNQIGRGKNRDAVSTEVPLVSGSAAISVARRARAEVQKLQLRLAEVELEREQLAEQLEAESNPLEGVQSLQLLKMTTAVNALAACA
jgi:hypothetical protein